MLQDRQILSLCWSWPRLLHTGNASLIISQWFILSGFVCYRLFTEEPADSTPDCSKARISPLKNGTPNVSRTCESGLTVLAAADSSIEHRRSSVDTSLSGIRSTGPVLSADRPQHFATSRPGRDGIKLNSDASRMVSLLKKQDTVSSEVRPDVQGLTTSQSYVDKFNEFLYHGKWVKTCKCQVFLCKL